MSVAKTFVAISSDPNCPFLGAFPVSSRGVEPMLVNISDAVGAVLDSSRLQRAHGSPYVRGSGLHHDTLDMPVRAH